MRRWWVLGNRDIHLWEDGSGFAVLWTIPHPRRYPSLRFSSATDEVNLWLCIQYEEKFARSQRCAWNPFCYRFLIAFV
eukprot:3343063-Amphidinium_carterae.1